MEKYTFSTALRVWFGLVILCMATAVSVVLFYAGAQFILNILAMILRSPVALVLAVGIGMYIYHKFHRVN